MLIVMILMRLWLVLSLSAAAPVPPIVEKEAKEDTASVDIVNGDGIIDIVNGDDINSDALHSHSSENTNRYPRNIYIGGDVHIEIEGDNNQINLASIFGEDASQDDHTMSPRFQAVDGGWSNWSEYGQCSKECGGGRQTRTRTCTNPVPQHKGQSCEQQNIGDPTETKDCNLHNCVDCVTSPGYPDSYPANSDDTQILSVEAGMAIEITFHDFDVEKHIECSNDYLEFFDGNDKPVGGKLCGKSLPQKFTILTSTASAVFHSDFNTRDGRLVPFFLLGNPLRKRYKFCYKPVDIEKCVTSPGYPDSYPANSDVTQILSLEHVEAGRAMEITFHDFDVESNKINCYDYLKFFDGNDKPVGGKLCGKYLPQKLTISTSTASAVFHSDFSGERKGYKFCYRPGSFDECEFKTCGERCQTGVCDGHGFCVDPLYNPCVQHGCGGKSCGDQCLFGDLVGRCDIDGDCDFDSDRAINSCDKQAVDGGWSNWSEYGQCTKSCGGGRQTRTRTCTNPVPHHKGRTCEQQNIGDHTETKDCNRHNCVCTAGKVNEACFCENGQEGGQDCVAEQVCTSGGACLDVCTAGKVNEACFCENGQEGGQDCVAQQVCTSGGACLDGDGCFSAEGCPLVQNNLITTLMELKKEFHITFEFQPTQYISGWQNVLFMTTGGNADKKVVLWVKDDGQLHPWFTGQHITTEKKYPIGQWHSVEFSQRLEDSQYFYRVKINGVQVNEVENNEPNIFSDVKVYASDPLHNALKGSLRNLVITMEKTKGDAAKEEPKTGCGFDDIDVRTSESTKPVANAHNFVKVETWYEWKEGKIPYYFKGSIIAGDKNLIEDVMNEIEQHTCFEFILHDTEPLGHHLEIVVESDSCVNGFSAYVKPQSFTKILLHSDFQFTDVGYCGNHRGGILHEMMHVFGIMHTHNRNDRDHYITVYQNNIDDMYKSQFKKCEDCKTYRQIPYECDSIMHYGYGICAKQSYGAKTMKAKDPSKCRLSERGALTPTKNDWKLLTIIGVQVCGAKKFGYGSLGCWRDYRPLEAVPSLEGLDSRLEGNFKERINAVEICFEVAKSRGYPIFGVHDGGECCGSSDAMTTYKKYKQRAENCGADGKGGLFATEVYNIQGSCEVHVGRSETETKNFIWATVSEGCECPAEVDKNNWLGGYDNTDKFLVTQTGQELKVQRTDNPGGWLIDLAFMCVIRGSCEVYVGKSDSNIKSATVEEGCKCPEEVDIDNSVGGQNKVLKFAVTQNGKILKVQRMDSNVGWSMDLSFKCKHTGNLIIPSLKQLRIEIHKLKYVVNGVKKEQVEDLQKSSMDEKEKESINKLNMATEHLKEYCSRSENEGCQSKQILVYEKEIEQIKESLNQDITGNGKIGKEFLINLKEKLEELDGAATEAQQSWKHQTDCVFEENINYLGNNLHSDATKSDSVYQCSKLCGMTEGCKYWTQSEQGCWLKDSNTGRRYDRDAISGEKDCPKGDYLTETMRILIATIKELKKMVNGLGRDDKIEKSDDETELLNIMDELTRNLKNHCTNKNGICKSDELLTLINKLESTFEKIKETGKISSGFLVNFEEFAENLVLAAENSHNFIKEGPTSFTECKSGTDCSCGSESCTEGQICTDAKCLNECEVKEGELLLEDCFCQDKEEGKLCEGGIDICTEHGCLDTSHHAFFFLIIG